MLKDGLKYRKIGLQQFKESSANTVNTVKHSIEGVVLSGVGVQISPVAPSTTSETKIKHL
jgi:hypothetical protein